MIIGSIRRRDKGATVLPAVARTATAFERMRGLLGRPAPAPGEGLLIRPCNSVHTLFMRYPIDVIFLNGQGRVLKIVPRMKAFRCAAARGAAAVLETKAGEAERAGIATGDLLDWGETTNDPQDR